MWIMNRSKTIMINSDQIVSIWMDHGCIKAKLRDGKDGYAITLGAFADDEELAIEFSSLYLDLTHKGVIGHRVG